MPSDKISKLLLKEHQEQPKPTGDEISMSGTAPVVVEQSTEPMPAPPPIQPQASHQNPYEFIMNPNKPVKKSVLPGGNSKTGRLIVVGAGATVLLIVGFMAFSLISGAGKGLSNDYTSLAQQQTELVRISEIGVSKARQSDARNLAVTTKLTMVSQGSDIQILGGKVGAKLDSKTLALGQDTKIDAQLTTADQANQFDETFTKAIQQKLQAYQQTLKKIYDATSNKTTKATLSEDFDEINTLIGNQSKDGTSSSSPATN